MAVDEPRRCLNCNKKQNHRLHGAVPRHRDAWGIVWYGKRPTMQGYFFHDYDPGERRAVDRRGR